MGRMVTEMIWKIDEWRTYFDENWEAITGYVFAGVSILMGVVFLLLSIE